LALASDYHRRAYGARDWRKNNIGIKIKGVRNLDAFAPKMAGKSQPCSPGLQSVQTSTQLKLGCVFEARQKSAGLLDAPDFHSKPLRVERASEGHELALAASCSKAVGH
jgi:hypothetical protein